MNITGLTLTDSDLNKAVEDYLQKHGMYLQVESVEKKKKLLKCKGKMEGGNR